MPMEPATLVTAFGGLALGALLALLAALSRKGRTEDEARAYLAGFTYVLSDDPDAAIAELSRAAQLNRQTLETYFALGALFRRKGELDRAIRLHRNILLRPGLSTEVRRRAQLALALDYKHSALRDQAAETFEKLLLDDPDHKEAIVHYRQVLEELNDWGKAISLQVRLVALGAGEDDILAHLLAQASRVAPLADSEELSAKAVALRPECADAQLAWAQALLGVGRGREAAVPLARAIELEPELAPRTLPLLQQAFTAPDEVRRLLKNQTAQGGDRSVACAFALALHHKSQGETDDAVAALRLLVERNPDFWEARKELGVLLLQGDRSEELKVDYEQILGTLGQPTLGFICEQCRQKLPEHLFRCPSCQVWDTVRREVRPQRI